MKRRLIAWMLATTFACWPTALLAQNASDTASQTTPLSYRRDHSKDARPINIDADHIAMWRESSNRVALLLRGNVVVQQDDVRVTAQQAVVWVETREGGTKRLAIYAEGVVRLEGSGDPRESTIGLIELNTTAKDTPTIRPRQPPIAETSMANDPLVLRGLAQRSPPPQAPAPSPAPAALIPTHDVVPPPALPSVVQQARYEDKSNEPPLAAPGVPAQTVQLLGPAVPPALPPPGGQLPIVPGPKTPPPLPPAPGTAQDPRLPPIAALEVPLQRLSVSPRSSAGFQLKTLPQAVGDDHKTFIITGGAIISVRSPQPGIGVIDIEADNVVIWTRGIKDEQLQNNTVPEGTGREIEFYLVGNVELRQRGQPDPRTPNVPAETRTLRAEELYYDVNRSVAIALKSQLEFKTPPRFLITDPVDFSAEKIIQHAESQYEILRGQAFSSKLPSDPGLKVYFTEGTIESLTIPRFSPFGWAVNNRVTGEQDTEQELYFRGRNVFFELENIPFFYSPYLAGNLLNPLGPVEEITFGYSGIFGLEFGTTLNVYDLLGIQPYEGTKWRLHFDGLTARGPAVGSTFDFGGKEPFNLKKASYDGTLSFYTIYDDGYDVLGGDRAGGLAIPVWRGRALWRDGNFDLPYGFQVQSQASYLSDHNFLEQYFNKEYETDINQETYAYVKQSVDNWSWTALISDRIGQEWFTRDNRLPELTGHIYELPGFDQYVTYMGSASAGYYQLRPTDLAIAPPTSYYGTDQNINTGRFDFMQELDIPFAAGAFKIVPYGMLDLADYTQDLDGNNVGRIWGAGGVRASIPFSHIYPNVESELFNLNGINHKIVFSANYFYSQTNVRFMDLPQIDRLNDDATDQAIRDIKPQENAIYPGGTGLLLSGYPLYDPQLYAVRNLLLNRIDTLDDIEVLQLDVRQRWQTHRGYPGNEHIVDWMTLDLSASYFPNSKDNFGSNLAFLQYDWLWNIGDRTALQSTAWVDPETHGPREYTIGAFLNRPDGAAFYLGYRQIDPLQSRAVTIALGYQFSPKYQMSISTTYDFGNSLSESTQVLFTRLGTDIQVSAGFNYNALLNTYGVLFEIVPNLVPANKRPGVVGALGQGGLLTH